MSTIASSGVNMLRQWVFVFFFILYAIHSNAEECPSDAGEKTFTQRQLQGKRLCAQLTRDECIFIHEARDKCTCTCDILIHNPSTMARPMAMFAQPGDQQDGYNGAGEYRQAGHAGPAGCFHGDSLVNTPNGKIPIKDIYRRNDVQVLTRKPDGTLAYADISAWIHAVSQVSTIYVELRTESDHKLLLTSSHLIYETDCHGSQRRTVFAEHVRPSSCIFVFKDNKLSESKVVQKSRIVKTGIYSPITTSGNIIVDDVLASCYSTFANERLQHILFSYVSMMPKFLRNLISLTHDHVGPVVQDKPIPALLNTCLSIHKYFVK